MSAASTTTLGQRAARILFSDETISMVKVRGTKLTEKEVADVIDGCATPQKTGDKIDHASFGDRKKVPPTPEQITAYSAAIGYPMNGQAWCDAYAQKGWKVGAKRMVDWQAAVRNWKSNGYGQDGIALAGAAKPEKPRNYGAI